MIPFHRSITLCDTIKITGFPLDTLPVPDGGSHLTGMKSLGTDCLSGTSGRRYPWSDVQVVQQDTIIPHAIVVLEPGNPGSLILHFRLATATENDDAHHYEHEEENVFLHQMPFSTGAIAWAEGFEPTIQ